MRIHDREIRGDLQSQRGIGLPIRAKLCLAQGNRLLRNLSGIDEAQVSGWLITVARNRARDYWRRNSTEQRYLETVDIPVSTAGDQEEGGLFDNPDLKPIHRLCLVLRFREGMTRSEIAREVGLTETQVKGHLQYSLQLLRKALASKDGGAYAAERS